MNIITEESKTEFKILLHSPIDFLAVAFIMAIKSDNRALNQKNIIWQYDLSLPLKNRVLIVLKEVKNWQILKKLQRKQSRPLTA